MAQEETYGTRDRIYSVWHRRKSTSRFVGWEGAQLLAMIDIDVTLYVEYDDKTKEPIAIIETAKDVGQSFKPSTVTRNLARRCVPELKAFVLLYEESEYGNPGDVSCPDIASFRVKQIHPEFNGETNAPRGWHKCPPDVWANYLLKIRVDACVDLHEYLTEGGK
jgi:hypothetical protein